MQSREEAIEVYRPSFHDAFARANCIDKVIRSNCSPAKFFKLFKALRQS